MRGLKQALIETGGAKRLADESAVGAVVEGVADNGGFDAGGWGYYTGAVAGKIGAVLFAGCVPGVEGEGKDVETECCAKSVSPSRTGHHHRGFSLVDEERGGGAKEAEGL